MTNDLEWRGILSSAVLCTRNVRSLQFNASHWQNVSLILTVKICKMQILDAGKENKKFIRVHRNLGSNPSWRNETTKQAAVQVYQVSINTIADELRMKFGLRGKRLFLKMTAQKYYFSLQENENTPIPQKQDFSRHEGPLILDLSSNIAHTLLEMSRILKLVERWTTPEYNF